jgi:hypothetical protein
MQVELSAAGARGDQEDGQDRAVVYLAVIGGLYLAALASLLLHQLYLVTPLPLPPHQPR